MKVVFLTYHGQPVATIQPDTSPATGQRRGPLNCPKGYGLCWTCSTWCDQPGSEQNIASTSEPKA